MHFGLEEWVAWNTPYVEYTDVDGGRAGQFGVRSSGVWQRHLSAGLGISESTYNLPGGAHGRMQTDAFSLAGYSSLINRRCTFHIGWKLRMLRITSG